MRKKPNFSHLTFIHFWKKDKILCCLLFLILPFFPNVFQIYVCVCVYTRMYICIYTAYSTNMGVHIFF